MCIKVHISIDRQQNLIICFFLHSKSIFIPQGNEVEDNPYLGVVQLIVRDFEKGIFTAVSDSRKDGAPHGL